MKRCIRAQIYPAEAIVTAHDGDGRQESSVRSHLEQQRQPKIEMNIVLAQHKLAIAA